MASIIAGKKSPYCPGCGHLIDTNMIARALENLNIAPLDVVIVSDIGCCGLVDGMVNCHTVHGLHGRSTALALGIALGLNNPAKKVIVIQGDGGATIGLQHILEAARQNVNMILIIQNNLIYGMTGGQISGLSPSQFKESRLPQYSDIPPFDIVDLAYRAGAAFCTRLFIEGDFSGKLQEAFQTPGFSLVEIVGMCPSYGIKKTKELKEISEYGEIKHSRSREPFRLQPQKTDTLFKELPQADTKFESPLQGRLEIIIAGSAGEGIQSAGELLALAGMASGLQVTKKGEYPVTVGTGFSVAEVILSRETIHYTGIDHPDIMIIVSPEGLTKVRGQMHPRARIIADTSLEIPAADHILQKNFQQTGGKKGAALSAITFWLQQSGIISVAALKEAAGKHRHGQKLLEIIEKSGNL